MAEPQPSNVQEGADAPDVLPANAEDRKAARAMSSLDANGTDEATPGPKREVDLKALGEAMKNLDMSKGGAAAKTAASGATTKKTEEPKKLVKVDPAAVNFLVDQLDLSKAKATELLRAHDADTVKAITAWVEAS